MRTCNAHPAATIIAATIFLLMSTLQAGGQTSITTYHYDNYRTGWNKTETVLTPASVWSPNFGLLHTITVDEQVDAQPLVVPSVTITAGSYQGVHDVVYVATENNTVYAVDVHSGTILLSQSLGSPVPKPLNCNNNGPYVGINSTPVIDAVNKLLYVMAYTNNGPTYTLYGLAMGSLAKQVSTVVSASHTLTNGTTFTFNATYQRQRPGLLLANGYIYAGFGSFCDFDPALSRGWLLGWAQGTLTPLAHNELMDTQASDSGSFFLSSIWMSGYGPATDDSGNILFVTGNSDSSVDTYDGITDLQESVVKVKYDLSTVLDHFTPSNQFSLDQGDTDFGAGGVLVLPDQPGSIPHMAVAAGKDGNMYFMNEDDLGGFSPTINNVLGTYSIGNCWCGESYYVDPSDGLGRVVSSGGAGNPASSNTLGIWKVSTTPSASLSKVSSSGVGYSVQAPGFFTSISSNGTAKPIIWALDRPLGGSNPISLLAFDPESGATRPTQLLSINAGSWPNVNGNANLVPVVANGQVFVATNKQLQIFGLTGSNLAVTKTATVGTNVAPEGQCPSLPTGEPWSSPSSAASSVYYATTTIHQHTHPPYDLYSQCLNATGFNFSIPSNATILGIQVAIWVYVSNDSTDMQVQLLSNGPTGGVIGSGPIGNLSPENLALGGWNSAWGVSWTPAAINQSNFGAAVQAFFPSGTDPVTVSVDEVQITVFYTP